MKRLCMGLILVLAAGVQAQQTAVTIPDLPSANLQVNWSDFKALLQQLQPPPPPPIAPPPVPWSLNSAVFLADATTPNAVRIEAEYHVHVWAEGWNKIPLLGAEAALESALLDDKPSFLSVEKDQFVLLLDHPGAHVLKVVFHVPLETKEGVASFGFPCAHSSVSRMTLRLGVAGAVVSAPAAADISTQPMDGGMSADLVLRGGDKIDVSWRLPAKALPPKEPPRIACRQSTLATVSERLIASRSLLQFDLLRGETTQFALRLPAEVRVTQLEGTGAEWSTREEADAQAVSVAVNHAVKDHYELTLSYECPIVESAASVALPPLDVLDMERQSAFLAVATRGPVETKADTLPAGVRRIDANELPAALRMQSVDPILHAFVLDGEAALPVLELRRLEEVPVLVAGIDQARYESVVTEQGLMLTRATWTVRNNLKKFLRVNLGPDVEVWGATVSGREVRPARESADSPPGEMLIPLSKSNEAGRRVDSFLVELCYLRHLPASSAWTGALSFETPKTDIAANRVAWEILLPASQRVFRTAGEFTPVDRLSPTATVSSAPVMLKQGVASVASPGTPVETLRRLREGMEKMPLPKTPQQAVTAAATAVEGIQPVRLELPRVGESHCFERVLVPKDTVLRLSLRVYDAHLATLLRIVLRLVAVLFGLLATRRLWRRFTRITQANTAVAFVLLASALNAAGLPPAAVAGWVLLGAAIALALRWRSGQPLALIQT